MTHDTTARSGDGVLRAELKDLQAYVVPDRRGLIKLDAMENPFPWPGELTDLWLEHLRGACVNRYPDPRAQSLRELLRASMGLPEGLELMFGNGSDELIQLLALAVVGEDRALLAPEPSFSMYRAIAAMVGMRYLGVPLREDFSLDPAAMVAAIDEHRPALIFLAYPNNPTGNLFAPEVMREIARRSPGLVIVDEAYSAFTDGTFVPEIAEFPNLLVLRTLSKLGLAGLRLGYLIGARRWLAELDKLRLPYNVNTLSQLTAEFALRHGAVIDEQTAAIRAQRSRLIRGLERLPGLQVYPSEANFVLFRLPPGRAPAVDGHLRASGILIKNLHRPGTPMADTMRVSVGTPREVERFLEAMAEALK